MAFLSQNALPAKFFCRDFECSKILALNHFLAGQMPWNIPPNSSHIDQWMWGPVSPSRGSCKQPRSSCVPPPTYHPQRPESHEESPSYSWYKNAYFRSFLKTDSPIGCIVTLHWLHDRAFGTLSLRENDLSSIFVRYFIHIRSGVRCEKYYGSSMFVLERPLSSACIGFH